MQKFSSVFLDSPIHHTSKPYLVKTHNYKKFVICTSMFYHINEKSALLMSIFRERFCNKEQIKKKSKHLSDEKNLVFLLGMIDWTEDILRFIFNGLHFKTLFYILHIIIPQGSEHLYNRKSSNF